MQYLDNVKRLREMHNWSQKELADGICSQAMISKIEQQAVSPDIGIMIAIAKKFNLTLSQLINENSTGNLFDNVRKEIRRLNEERKYQRLYDYLQEIRFEDMSYPIEFKNWVYSIVQYEVFHKKDEALKLLREAYKNSNNKNSEIRILVLIALATIHTEDKKYDKAIRFFKEAYDIHTDQNMDKYMKKKLLYNLGRCYLKMNKTIDTIFYAHIAIQNALDDNNMNLLDDTFLLLANAYLKSGDYDKSLINAKKAQSLAEIKQNIKLIPYIERTILQLQTIMAEQPSVDLQ